MPQLSAMDALHFLSSDLRTPLLLLAQLTPHVRVLDVMGSSSLV